MSLKNLIVWLSCTGCILGAMEESRSAFAQSQQYQMCKQEFDATKPGSREQLKASLKLTDALYYFNLDEALEQANESFEMASSLSDKNALAVCEMDMALITGWLKGHEAALDHFETAIEMFDESAPPEYRVHFYSSAILYKIFRSSGDSELARYFRLNDIASKECDDSLLILHQNMLAAFNRVVLGRCSPSAPEIQFSREQIARHNKDVGLLDADVLLAILDAWEALANENKDAYLTELKHALEISRRSENRLYVLFTQSLLGREHLKNKEWQAASAYWADNLKVAKLHNSPPLVCESYAQLSKLKLKEGKLEEAERLLNRALAIHFSNSRSDASRHQLYKLAIELYCAKEDIPNIQKYVDRVYSADHLRAVVETEKKNRQLSDKIAELQYNRNEKFQRLRDSNSTLETKLRQQEESSNRKIRALTFLVASLAIVGLFAALVISRNRLHKVERKLSAEKEFTRHGNEIREGLELKLDRLRRMESLGLMAGGVAHDFNNLLVGVLGNAEILKLKSDQSDSFTSDRIDQIILSAEKAANLSHQMLAYTGKQNTHRRSVDLNSVVRSLVPVLKSSCDNNVKLETSLWSLPLVSEVDETQIEQVLLNLVSNAVSASKAGEAVIIRTGQETIEQLDPDLHGTRTEGGQFNYIEVEDSGRGIAETDLERVFEPFYTDKENGRGLGLAVVYGTVNGHEGLIRASSKVGNGSKFRVLIPTLLPNEAIKSEPNTDEILPASEPPDSLYPTVLVVDDESSVLDLTRQLLRIHGWNVLVAANGQDALIQIESHRNQIRCVLLDVVMPEMGAVEVLQELEERDISLPIVLMSGFSHKQLGDYQSDPRVVSILEKPFRLNKLMEAIEEASAVYASRVA